ncbi:P2X purinoceptor 7-like [Ixodes scapularis]
MTTSDSSGSGSGVPSDEENEEPPRKSAKVVPYACDPSASSDDSDIAAPEGVLVPRDDGRRLHNTLWCCCNSHCASMPTTTESVCCKEQAKVKEKAGSLPCITKHHLFQLYCLNRDILDLEYAKLRVSRPLSLRNRQHINAYVL